MHFFWSLIFVCFFVFTTLTLGPKSFWTGLLLNIISEKMFFAFHWPANQQVNVVFAYIVKIFSYLKSLYLIIQATQNCLL